jgi:hypothetical protein
MMSFSREEEEEKEANVSEECYRSFIYSFS